MGIEPESILCLGKMWRKGFLRESVVREEPVTKMRKKWQEQMPLMPQTTDHAQSKELEVISNIICQDPWLS